MEKKDALIVRTLGDFTITWQGSQISGGSRDSQFTRLMEILLHYSETGVERGRLEEMLFEDSNSMDLHNMLRSVIYNAKKKLEKAGLPTVNDILKELAKPGLDPREQASEFAFAEDIHGIEDLQVGMELPGIVTNITNFGAFVDIGIHDNGLVHVSQMGPRGTDPTKVVKLHQQVRVAVTAVDLDRGRISLRLLK